MANVPSIVRDRRSLDVDVVIATLGTAPVDAPRAGVLRARAIHLGPPDAVILDLGPTSASWERELVAWSRSPGGRIVLEASAALDRLRALGRAVRVVSQSWTAEASEAIDAFRDAGLDIDTTLVPDVAASAVQHWNTKIGGQELLDSIVALRDALPPSTIVTSLAEAATVVSSLARPCVLKVNQGAGGAGIIALAPGFSTSPAELLEVLSQATAGELGGKLGPAGLAGPYLLQQVVGGDIDSFSPSVDLCIDDEGVECIAVAEQILDGFRYAGARFPGAIDHAVEQRCVGRATAVAEVLRARGYRGLVNVDLVVDGDREWVIELNLRQSAPLDQSLRATARWGEGWRDGHAFRFLEDDGRLELT